MLLQWFENNNIRLPSLSAIARIEPVAGDGFCVVYSMLASQGQPIDKDSIQDCLGWAQHNCKAFLTKQGMD